jgi:hypothetical protein
MMVMALALQVDPVFVGAHHLTRVFLVSLTMPLVVRWTAPPGVTPLPPPRPKPRRSSPRERARGGARGRYALRRVSRTITRTRISIAGGRRQSPRGATVTIGVGVARP